MPAPKNRSLISRSSFFFVVVATTWVVLFWPNMIQKDKSLRKYPQFDEYKRNTNLLFPKFG